MPVASAILSLRASPSHLDRSYQAQMAVIDQSFLMTE